MAKETRVEAQLLESLSQCLSLSPVSGSQSWVPYSPNRQPICMVPTSQVPSHLSGLALPIVEAAMVTGGTN